MKPPAATPLRLWRGSSVCCALSEVFTGSGYLYAYRIKATDTAGKEEGTQAGARVGITLGRQEAGGVNRVKVTPSVMVCQASEELSHWKS